MIAVDTNLLVYAHREDSAWHDEAYEVIRELAEGASPWAVPWPCLHEFLAIATPPRIFSPPTPLVKAIDQIDAWLESPSLHLLSEQPGAWDSLRALLVASKTTGPAVHDARIAALVCSTGFASCGRRIATSTDFATFASETPWAEVPEESGRLQPP